VESSIYETWEKTEKSVKKMAEKVLGFQGKRSINKWFNEECRTAMVERDNARTIMLRDPSEANKRELALKQRKAKQIIRKNKRMWKKARIETIENSYKNNTKLFFEKANEVKNGFKPRSTIMKDDEGTLITDKEEVTKEFKKVFEKMLNVSTQTETSGNNVVTVEQYLEEPSLEEIKMAVEMLKGEKASGEDSIMSELLKKEGSTLMMNLKQLINKIWREKTIPKSWQVSILCPIYKKGHVMDCKNYRGISLLNTSYKVLSNIILNRLKPHDK
jgi:hypothetical protein